MRILPPAPFQKPSGAIPPADKAGDSRRTLLLGAAGLAVFSGALNLLHLVLPLYSMQIFDRVLSSGSFPTLIALASIASFLVLSMILLDAIRGALLVRLATHVDILLRRRLTAAAEPANGRRPALGQGTRDLLVLRGFLAGSAVPALFDLPFALLFLAAVASLDLLLGALALSGVLVMPAIALISHRIARSGQAAAAAAQTRILDLAAATDDNRETLATMGGYASLRQELLTASRQLLQAAARVDLRRSATEAVLRGFRQLLQLALLTAAAALVLLQDMQPGAIVASAMLFARALIPLERLTANWRSIGAARQAYRRLAGLVPASGPTAPPIGAQALVGQLEVEGLCSGADRQGGPYLCDVSFQLEAGEMLAVVGATGSGKSTLARAVAGADAPGRGTVRLAGLNLEHLPAERRGRHVGYLPQTTRLFGHSIAAFIARHGAEDEAEIVEAARLAGVHETILRLPEGYATRLDREDIRLSPGEQQRIALARAFFGRPALIVLDEPLMHLDDRGERLVVSALTSLRQGGSTIVVVCRFVSLLHAADHVMLLNEGRVQFLRPRAALAAALGPRLAASNA
jgi:PrtD family type I secretion system ABC transporter